MKKYKSKKWWDWERVNWESIKEVGNWAEESFKEGFYFENLLIHILILEGTLRVALNKVLIEKRKLSEEEARKEVESIKYFSEVIQKFEIYTGDELCKKVKEIIEERNKIIHKLFFNYKNFNEAKEAAKKLGPKMERLKEEIKERYI